MIIGVFRHHLIIQRYDRFGIYGGRYLTPPGNGRGRFGSRRFRRSCQPDRHFPGAAVVPQMVGDQGQFPAFRNGHAAVQCAGSPFCLSLNGIDPVEDI